MSEKNISIKTFEREDGIINISSKIVFDALDNEIAIAENGYLNLFNYPLPNGMNIKPREIGESFMLYFKIGWEKGASLSDLQALVENNEKAYELLIVKAQVVCRTSRWCSEQIQIPMIEIGSDYVYHIAIPLSEIKGIISLSADVIRQSTSKKLNTTKATESYTIISSAESVTIQIDEIKELGNNYLPIRPEHIGDYVFDLFGFDNELQLPVIRYTEDFKDYFTNDDLITTNATFFISIPYFLDHYLKWLIFICKYDSTEKIHKGLVELFSKYCGISKASFIEVIEKEKFCEEQIKLYYSLSLNLFKGIQVNSDFKYKSQLKRLFQKELLQSDKI